jgi:hypothetical protein
VKLTIVVIWAALAAILGPLPALAAGPAFQAFGRTAIVSASAVNCLDIHADCTFAVVGNVNGSIKGSITSVITIFGATTRSPNGSGGFCARFRAFTTMSANGISGESLSLFERGSVCADGAQAASAPHTFEATYAVAGGKGSFLGSSGVGALNTHETSAGTFEFNYEGSLLPGPQAGS